MNPVYFEYVFQVIPEFDMPGHGYAAIKAMQKRSNDTGNTMCNKNHYTSVSEEASYLL